MKHLLSLFLFCALAVNAVSAQQAARQTPVVTEAERFAGQVERLQTAWTANDQPNVIALESAVLGGMRRELERAEAAQSPALVRQREIFAAFENFSFYQAKRADVDAKLLLLKEFAELMQ